MRENLSQLSFARRRRIPRVLALILLVAIGWGANAEVTHHHGFLKGKSERSFQGSLQDACSSSEASRKRSSTRDECLICQLHQNLSAGAPVQLPHQTPTVRQFPRPTAAVIAQRTQFITSERGRAPPVSL